MNHQEWLKWRRPIFMARISIKESCWIYSGVIDKDGYRQTKIKGKCIKAHRASYILFKDTIPPFKLVCHTCDNRACVNPDHLYIGTAKSNSDDMYNRGRSFSGDKHWTRKNPERLKGEKNNNCRISDSEVEKLKSLYQNPYSSRELAIKFNLSQRQVLRILHGESRK